MRPYDGYIVDSVGWAYYQLGRYDDAAQTLEAAVLLVPGDPTINDHLGDALWRSGRKIDARFQWNHALTFSDNETEKAAIEQKLKTGLSRKSLLQCDAERAWRGQDQSVSACRRPPRRRLSSAAEPGCIPDAGDGLTAEAADDFRFARRAVRGGLDGDGDNLVLQGGARAGRARGTVAAGPFDTDQELCRWRQASAAAAPMRRRRCAPFPACGSLI